MDIEKLLTNGKPGLFCLLTHFVENFVSYTLQGSNIVKAFVEFGRETSNTKSSSHAEYET